MTIGKTSQLTTSLVAAIVKLAWPLVALLFALWLLFLLADKLAPLPDVKADTAQVLLAADGTPLWRFADANGVWRYPVTIEQVSPLYLEALLAYEDRWFYQHWGVNPLALLRAAWLNLRHGRIVSGGSTLSMQVARIVEPHSRSWQGKLRQIWRTLQLEWHYSKDEILEIYLNRAPFGGTLEGVSAASWAYLAKPPSQLLPAEAALLAVLPQAPSRLRPDRYPQRAKAARDKLLQRLQRNQVWSQQQLDEAMADEIWLANRQEPALAPLLARRLKSSKQALVHSTIDYALQQQLETLLLDWKHRLPAKTSAAILVVDSQSMQVKAYLGSADLHDSERSGHVDMISSIRSPGSTLKPFLYALALEDGLIHSESLLQDVPRAQADYQPGNFSRGFSGPVSASEALLSSLNLPAVQLLEHYDSLRFDARLRQAGIKLRYPNAGKPNLAMILGGTGTNLESLVRAYAALVRDGMTANLRFVADESLQEQYLLAQGSAWIVHKILSGQSGPYVLQQSKRQGFAWKTGTSHGHRDAWAVGAGNGYVIGVWVGRPDGGAVPGQLGQLSAVPLMLRSYDVLGSQRTKHIDMPQPDSVSVAAICWPSGQKMAQEDANCRRYRVAWTLNGLVPPTLPQFGLQQQVWQSIWVNQRGEQVAADCANAQAKQIALWPETLAPWLPPSEARQKLLPVASQDCPPPVISSPNQLRIFGVEPNARLQQPPASSKQQLQLSFNSLGASGRLWWFLNGKLVADSAAGEGFKHEFTQFGSYQVSAIDEAGNSAKLEFTIGSAE